MASAGWFVVVLAVVAVTSTLIAEAATGATPIPGLPVPSATVRYGIPIVRVLLDISLVATMGLALLAKFLGFDDPDRTETVMITARRVAVWTSGRLGRHSRWSAWCSTPRRSTRTTSRPGPTVVLDLVTAPLSFLQYLVASPDLIWNYISEVPAGKGLLVVAGLGLLSLWLCRISLRRGESVPAEMRAGIAAFGLLPIPLTGHATDWIYHDLMMMSMELHLIGAAAWAGGLGATIIFLSRRPGLLAGACRGSPGWRPSACSSLPRAGCSAGWRCWRRLKTESRCRSRSGAPTTASC